MNLSVVESHEKKAFPKTELSTPSPKFRGVGIAIEVTAPRSCFVASPAARPRIRRFTLAARSLEVGSCSTGVSRWAGAAGRDVPRTSRCPRLLLHCPLVPFVLLFPCRLFFLVPKSHQAGAGLAPLLGLPFFLSLQQTSLGLTSQVCKGRFSRCAVWHTRPHALEQTNP